MTKLKVGDIRQIGDEVRTLKPFEGIPNTHGACLDQFITTDVIPYLSWMETRLVGHEILSSDLMHAEYRRP